MATKQISNKIKKIEEALIFANAEIKILLDNDKIEQTRVNTLEKDYYIDEIKKMDLILFLINNRDVDAIIKTITASSSVEDASINLIEKCSLTKLQADSLLDLGLGELNDDAEEKRKEYQRELSKVENELNNDLLYNTLSVNEIQFIKKSLELYTSISKI